MGIMNGNEEAWLRMMLDDESMVESMGLPKNMSSEEKDQVIELMLNSQTFMSEFHRQDEEAAKHLQTLFSEKQEDETPCDWMVREALNEMDINVGIDKFEIGRIVDTKNLETGEYYQITFPNDKTATVKLVRVLQNSFGDDYIFENIEGAESLTSKSNSGLIGINEFPLPEQLLSSTKFNEIKRI